MGMPNMTPPVEGSFDRPRRKVPWFLILLICVVGFCLIMIALGTAIVLPAIARAQEVGQNRACISRLRILSRTLAMYTEANNDHYPLSILPQNFAPGMRANRYLCPRSRMDYHLNWKLAGKPVSSVTDKEKTLTIYEQAKDGTMIFPHSKKANGVFADGSVRSFGSDEKLSEPKPPLR